MKEDSEPREPRRARRRPRRWLWLAPLLLLGLLVAAITILANLEAVRAAVLTRLLARALGAEVELHGVALWQAPGLQSLTIRDPDAPPDAPPLVQIEDLALDYRLRPGAMRYIESLRARRITVHIEGMPPGNTNYDFLLRRMQAEPEQRRDLSGFIPEHVEAGAIALHLRQPGWSLDVEGMRLEALVETLDQMRGVLEGAPVRAAWQHDGEHQEMEGPVTLALTRANERLSAAGQVAVPGLLRFDGHAEVFAADPTRYELTIHEAVLEAAMWPQLLAQILGIPIEFEQVHITSGSAAGQYPQEPLPLDRAQLTARIEGFSIPVEEAAATPGDIPPDPPSTGNLETGEAGDPREPGTLTLDFTRTGEDFELAARLELPTMATLEANASLLPAEEGYLLEAAIPLASVQHPVLVRRLLREAPGDLSAQTLDLREGHVTGTWREGSFALREARAEGSVGDLRYGAPEQPWYQGDVAGPVQLTRLEGATQATGRLHLAAGEPLDFSLQSGAGAVALRATLPQWPRDALIRNLPAQADTVLTALPGLEALGGSVQVDWQEPTYQITADLRAGLAETPSPVPVTLTGAGALPESPFTGEVAVRIGESAVSGTVEARGAEDFTADLRLEGVEPNAWMQAWLQRPLHASLNTHATGALEVRGTPEAYALELDLRLAGPAFGNFALPGDEILNLRGPLRLRRDMQHAESSALEARVAERLDLRVEDLRVDVAAPQIATRLRGSVDLGYAGRILDLDELWGDVDFDIPTTIHPDGRIELALSAESESMGYGDLATPYNVPLHAEGVLNYLPEPGRIEAAPLELRLGDGSQLQMGSLRWNTDTAAEPRLSIAEATLHTDMRPLVTRGYLGQVDGAATVEAATLTWHDGAWTADFRPDIQAAVFALPERLARLEDMRLRGDFRYDGTLTGQGALESGSLLVGGVTLRDISTALSGRHRSIFFDGLRSRLFDGALEASGSVGLLEEGLPMRLEASIEDGDLATFTREFEPPAVTLTGRFSGNARVGFAREVGVLDFGTTLVSTEGFTMNRDMVEQLLFSEYVESITGGGRVDRVVQDVIGRAEQRSFDNAVLRLGFIEERITGQAELESRALGMTINVAADPEALVEALKLRQEQAR